MPLNVKPLWVTERSCLDDTSATPAEEATYLHDAVAALEADPQVVRYAWFTGRMNARNGLVDLLGAIAGGRTALGTSYLGQPFTP